MLTTRPDGVESIPHTPCLKKFKKITSQLTANRVNTVTNGSNTRTSNVNKLPTVEEREQKQLIKKNAAYKLERKKREITIIDSEPLVESETGRMRIGKDEEEKRQARVADENLHKQHMTVFHRALRNSRKR